MAELKWLEDLLVLMEEDSFTKAAQRRFVTQPAFSRRIRLLEDWFGVELVDRRRKPIAILPLAREQEARIRELISNFYQLRNNLQNSNRHQRTGFVVQHTLAVSHFPSLIRKIQPTLPHKAYRLHTANNEDCADSFSGDVSFMLCYQLPGQPLLSADNNIQYKVLYKDRLIPVVQRVLLDDNNPLKQTLTKERGCRKSQIPSVSPESRGGFKAFTTPSESTEHPLPLLMFPKGGFLADVLAANCLPGVMRDYPVDIICESAFAISLKEMVLAGMGIAWLPEELVRHELENAELSSLENDLGNCILDVCLYYREGSGADEAFRMLSPFKPSN